MRKLSAEEMNRKSKEDFKASTKYPITVVLDNIRSALNVGSIFRTADAFLIEEIIICGISPQPPHKEIYKTALGSTESVNWQYVENSLDAVQGLKEKGYQVFAIEQTQNSIFLHQFELGNNQKIAIVLGNEVSGVEQEVIDICHGVIEIEQKGTKHSLNVAVTAGIVIWELQKKMNT